MAGITLSQAQSKLDMWMAAEGKLASAQSYTVDGRTLTRANLSEVSKQVTAWDQRVKDLSKKGGIRIQNVTPLG